MTTGATNISDRFGCQTEIVVYIGGGGRDVTVKVVHHQRAACSAFGQGAAHLDVGLVVAPR